MTCLVIDPFILACPPLASGQMAFDTYVENLAKWTRAKQRFDRYFASPPEPHIALNTSNKYPVWDDVEASVNAFNSIFQTSDVFNMVEGLLKSDKSLGDLCGIEDAITQNLSVNPDPNITSRPPALIDCFAKISAYISVATPNPCTNHAVITADIGQSEMSVAAAGTIAVWLPLAHCPIHSQPHNFNIDLKLVSNIAGLANTLDPITTWIEANGDEQGHSLSIIIALWQAGIAAGEHANLDKFANKWKFHREFLEHCRTWGFLHEPTKVRMLIRALVESIRGENLSAIHALRAANGPTAPQRRRSTNDDPAWRRDINRDFHLHYWQTTAGPEFAYLGEHDYFIIPE